MAAQSEAASVKVSPFVRRQMCAVLYSTSLRLASWSFVVLVRHCENAEWRSAAHFEIGARAARPGKTPSTSCPSLTTATPFTNTN
jgi:hypothetical protein